eukprot:m.306636 g.306636  ORF g.306636 m.306636 type:complete len:364 (-) comp16352_c0_seq6:66-1157(-)
MREAVDVSRWRGYINVAKSPRMIAGHTSTVYVGKQGTVYSVSDGGSRSVCRPRRGAMVHRATAASAAFREPSGHHHQVPLSCEAPLLSSISVVRSAVPSRYPAVANPPPPLCPAARARLCRDPARGVSVCVVASVAVGVSVRSGCRVLYAAISAWSWRSMMTSASVIATPVKGSVIDTPRCRASDDASIRFRDGRITGTFIISSVNGSTNRRGTAGGSPAVSLAVSVGLPPSAEPTPSLSLPLPPCRLDPRRFRWCLSLRVPSSPAVPPRLSTLASVPSSSSDSDSPSIDAPPNPDAGAWDARAAPPAPSLPASARMRTRSASPRSTGSPMTSTRPSEGVLDPPVRATSIRMAEMAPTGLRTQ